MAYSGAGLWYADTNTKIPGLTHLLSYRVLLAATGTTQTVVLPDTANNPGQVVKTNPLQPYATPQQGKRLFPYLFVVRDPAGVIAPTGSTGGGTIALIDQSQSNATVAMLSSTVGATSPLVQYQTLTSASVVINPYDQLAVTFTQPTGATSTVTGFTVDLLGYWQQGV